MKLFARRSPPMYILLIPGIVIGFFVVSTFPTGLSSSLALRAVLSMLGSDVYALRTHFEMNENTLRILGLGLDSAVVICCVGFMFVRIVPLEAAWARWQERRFWILRSAFGVEHPRARRIHAPLLAYLFLLLFIVFIIWIGWFTMYQE